MTTKELRERLLEILLAHRRLEALETRLADPETWERAAGIAIQETATQSIRAANMRGPMPQKLNISVPPVSAAIRAAVLGEEKT